jgi:hypothetical protein
MKELKSVKEMKQLLDSYSISINKEYMKKTLELLKKISIGEKLDYNELKLKYIKNDLSHNITSTEITSIDITSIDITSTDDIQESDITSTDDILDSDNSDQPILLDKIIVNNVIYYVNKKTTQVYNTNSDLVGYYKIGKVTLL